MKDPLERKNFIFSSLQTNEEENDDYANADTDSLDSAIDLTRLAEMPLEVSNSSQQWLNQSTSESSSGKNPFLSQNSSDLNFSKLFK
jgi:hypothetical protein